MTINEILSAYTEGTKTLEDSNAALKAAGSNLTLNPEKNRLTAEEIAATTVGAMPEDANGFALLDTGTGTLDKVFVENGKIMNAGCGEMYALCILGGKLYRVKGNRLTE